MPTSRTEISMNKLVALPIADAVPMMPTDKTMRLAEEVMEAERRARRSHVTDTPLRAASGHIGAILFGGNQRLFYD
jgi:hypothetical protein